MCRTGTYFRVFAGAQNDREIARNDREVPLNDSRRIKKKESDFKSYDLMSLSLKYRR